MKRNVRYEITVGIFVIAAAVILGYISLKISRLSVRDGIDVDFLFPHACGLVKDASVSVAGVDIGYVKGLKLESNTALVTARIESSAGLRKNIKATIRSKGLLGEQYLELLPTGTDAPLLQNGDLITDTIIPVQIDQTVSWAGKLLSGIDQNDAAKFINALSRDPDAAGRIIKNADKILKVLADLNEKQLREFIRGVSIRARLF